ncbi:UNVERIFIED_CONTAM: hypothetical protein FKN15_032620 [Acipenser sinensis]
MLFQSVVLRCQFSTSSSQQPVVQWWYKSYCHDRTREAFSFTDSVTHQIPDQGSTSHLDCRDSSRTVRPVASRQGITFTLGENYKGRDITITNNGDLQIGDLQWGDSGVYYCKVVTSDDLMGQNEDRMELLVLEWVFVGVVILGAVTFILFLGICWCQCCPHSCCCYVQCPCCPESCCCPRHLYEAGKAVKTCATPHIAPVYPPYYVPNVPMAAIGPPAMMGPTTQPPVMENSVSGVYEAGKAVKTCATPHIAPVYPPYYVPNVPMAAIGPPAMMGPTTQPPVMENSVSGVRSGYRIQANKEQDCMKVLYYVEKELAEFDPAKRTLRCDYSTSSNLQDVLVTWRYKSFCKDPILDYYSAGYQASLQLGQDPANDCSDSMREVRVVIQKRGGNEPVLGMEYRQRKITIQDKADLVISEVMWWDHGVYFCSIEASGDTTGDSDKEIKLVVYNWLVVIFIILGILLLILLLGVCWCQCCPHRCCCYVRCACCPTRCCCPEKAVMRYKMIKEAQKALMPWAVGQPIYAPQLPPPPHRGANNIQFRGGPPSILSSLNDIEVREIDRRVIHLPPIVEGLSHDNSSQGNRGYYSGSDRGARGPRNQGGSRSSQDSSLLNRQQPQDARRRRDDVQSNRRSPRRDFSPPRRQDLRSYSDESEYDGHRRPAAGRTGRGDTGGSGGSRYAGRRRSRSRDDLFNEPRRPQRRERSFSPPGRRSWSSDEDLSRRGGNGRSRNRDREGDWPEKPPSYSSVDILPGRANNRAHRSNEVYSVITKLLMLKQ